MQKSWVLQLGEVLGNYLENLMLSRSSGRQLRALASFGGTPGLHSGKTASWELLSKL